MSSSLFGTSPMQSQVPSTTPQIPNLTQDQITMLRNMYNGLTGTQDPMSMLKSQMNQNPIIKQTYDQIMSAGGDPKKAFMNEALNQGYNQLGIGQFISQLKSQMKIM